jgi:hypothetical protein
MSREDYHIRLSGNRRQKAVTARLKARNCWTKAVRIVSLWVLSRTEAARVPGIVYQSVSGVKFIGSSELWCWEVVKLLSYTRRGRAGGREESCCVLLLLVLSVHLLALPCLALASSRQHGPCTRLQRRKWCRISAGRVTHEVKRKYCLGNLNWGDHLGDLGTHRWRRISRVFKMEDGEVPGYFKVLHQQLFKGTEKNDEQFQWRTETDCNSVVAYKVFFLGNLIRRYGLYSLEQ